ncbi:DnaB-like helicase C-terminal domain-containing protein [Glycomyces mayteni]|uniref:DnaB-like helicase C-terminal domain-containing protein n=1 Tax=Glycomyces mayteni TaxID=543887 RepID=A0ABW2D5W4_9ACTN
MGAVIRRGQVHMWTAAPGTGKTATTLNYISAPDVRANVSTMYFSPDSDIMTIAPRMIGIMENWEVRNVFDIFEDEKRAKDQDKVLELSKSLKHIQWCFDYPLTFDAVNLEMEAYEAVHGHSPDLVVLDNVRDVKPDDGSDGGGDWQLQNSVVDFFKELAYKTGAAVVLLHHLTGDMEDGDKIPTLKSVSGKVGKNVRQVIGFFAPDPHSLGASVLKNSSGQKHFEGEYVDFPWNRATQVIG